MKEQLFAKIKALSLPAYIKGISDRFDLVVPIITLLLILLFLFYISVKRKNKQMKIRVQSLDSILALFNPANGLESNLSQFLELIIPVVEAPGYFFYILESKNHQYHLKAVRNRDPGSGQISPSYSGLVPFQKEKYNPPLAIPAGNILSEPVIVQDGAVPMLMMSVKGGMGLIKIGPVRSVSKESRETLAYLCEKMQFPLEIMIDIEKMKNQVESVLASSHAIQSLTKSAFDLDGSLAIIMGLCIKMSGSFGGCFLYKKENRIELALSIGLEKHIEEQLQGDHESKYLLYNLVDNEEFLVINREMKEYFSIPASIVVAGVDTVLVAKASGDKAQGTALLFFSQPPDLNKHRMVALQMLVKRLGDALDRQLQFDEVSNSYLDMLKMLVDTLDNMEPYTVSHSELISRYCGIIAKELSLGEKDIKEIMLAGYLHDVGMLGLSGDILFKTGRYTDIEYETMKLHTEVGAAIVESTLSKKSVASFIRHHHERWDGYGYPSGLKGGAIPLGARIIAVADMFNAKITGRKYREPASFENAIADLRSAAGLQLDPDLVDILINWFRKKQSDPSIRYRSLGSCWEMHCCPSSISQDCPAYRKNELNCWEIGNTNCAAHGKTCVSCWVFTEYMYRAKELPSGK